MKRLAGVCVFFLVLMVTDLSFGDSTVRNFKTRSGILSVLECSPGFDDNCTNSVTLNSYPLFQPEEYDSVYYHVENIFKFNDHDVALLKKADRNNRFSSFINYMFLILKDDSKWNIVKDNEFCSDGSFELPPDSMKTTDDGVQVDLGFSNKMRKYAVLKGEILTIERRPVGKVSPLSTNTCNWLYTQVLDECANHEGNQCKAGIDSLCSASRVEWLGHNPSFDLDKFNQLCVDACTTHRKLDRAGFGRLACGEAGGSSPAVANPSLEIGAAALSKEYNNIAAGDLKFKGKTIKVTGILESVDRNSSGGRFVVRLSPFVACQFANDDQIAAISRLKPGLVSVVGVCSGKDSIYVQLHGCVLPEEPARKEQESLIVKEGSVRPVAYSDSLSDREEIIRQMLQAGSQGKGEEVTSLAARASKIPKVQQADQRNQTLSRQHNDKGLEYARSEDYQNAVEEFEKAFALNAADIEIANNLGFVRSKLSKYDEAKKDLFYTLALAPSRVNAWFNLGGVLAHQEDSTMAAGAFFNAILFSPKKHITVASIQTDTEYGPPALTDAFQRVIKMPGVSSGLDSAPRTSAGTSSGEQSRQMGRGKTRSANDNAEDRVCDNVKTDWGTVKMSFGSNVKNHFAIAGWSTNRICLSAAEMQFLETNTQCAYMFEFKIDTSNKVADTKGCLRASFYTQASSGEKVKVPASFTDGSAGAMMPTSGTIMDSTKSQWSALEVRWTPDCRDTGKLYNDAKSTAQWIKK